MIVTLLYILVLVLVLQLLFSFVPGLDSRIVGIIILLVIIALFFDHPPRGRLFGARDASAGESAGHG